MRNELTESYTSLERAAMGVVSLGAPAPPRFAADGRAGSRVPGLAALKPFLGRVRAFAVPFLALAGMIWLTKDQLRSDWLHMLLAAATALLPPAFVIVGSLICAPRRPVPRLPRRAGDRVKAADGSMTGGGR